MVFVIDCLVCMVSKSNRQIPCISCELRWNVFIAVRGLEHMGRDNSMVNLSPFT